MMSRAEVVDILIRRNVPEAAAWEIALGVKPEYLEAMDEAAVWLDASELIWRYVERVVEHESEFVTPA